MSDIKFQLVRDVAFTPHKFGIQMSQGDNHIHIDITDSVEGVKQVIQQLNYVVNQHLIHDKGH